MSSIKTYTDIKQSKKLAEILPLKSADLGLYYSCNTLAASNQMWVGTKSENADIPCWSLAALRACLPSGISIDDILYVFESHNTFDNEWVYAYKYENNMAIYIKSSNEIDACYEMILKLHELNLL